MKEAVRVNTELNKHVPEGILSVLHLHYDTSDEDAFLDIYYPGNIECTEITLPVIVWTHGGGWISGNKEQVSNYCKILAGKGYIVVSVNYSTAPEEKYPTPVRQLMSALDFLKSNAQLYHINISNFILAGDSGGAHISAQAASIIVSPSYSELMSIKPALSPSQLSGLILYCGPYDIRNVNTEGEFGTFLNTVLWSYSGVEDYMNDKNFESASVIEYVTKDFPPVFISAGNGDPLESQSKNFAQKLETLGIKTDKLFFPKDHTPPLPHEYQFNLDTDAGKLALERSLKFLISISPPEFAEPEKIKNLTLNIQ
ncbi:MAG: alpha/beta hydrolase [Ignavibacteria bacterium]|nr:alpha/beta hydrolase [Ignavibacteria bacterium]